MPRWPAGLTPAAGSQIAWGGQPVRPPRPPQRSYWRRTRTPLFAAANGVLAPNLVFGPFNTSVFNVWTAVAGPQGAGEQWFVDLVQVQQGNQYGTPPLVTQQIRAQVVGQTINPPPPVVAQAWLQVGGTNVHLLAQTTTGGNDDMSVSCPALTVGEAIAVVWFGATSSTWMAVKGTRSAMSVI